MNARQQSASPKHELVLGLDIGAASIGWALVEEVEGRPIGLRAAGVRAFPAGTGETLSDFTAGRDESHAVKRRQARLRRRQLARRRHRLDKLALALQGAGLLPAGEVQAAEAAMAYFEALDRDLFPDAARKAEPHLAPYRLRARALDEELKPYEIGRALYHLAHRRGFLSNRRVRPRPAGAEETEEEKEEGKVKAAIGELARKMEASGARTLGEYLSRLDPREERVRGRYLSRKMLEEEFAAIWAAQAPRHPELLGADLRKRVHRAIFYQRPLKSARRLVGRCELDKGKRRAPLACLAAQRFRLLQKVNDLKIALPDGGERGLTAEERATLVEALERRGDLKFPAIRELLGLPKRGCKFNFETEGEKALIGNRTRRALATAFGEEAWQALGADGQERVVVELRSLHKPEAVKRRAMRLWGLGEEAADRLAAVALEDGYCNLSRQALAKVLPLMEEGVQYATVRKQVYGEEPAPRAVRSLPAVHRVQTVRNPAVERALTELRKVVNAILREHGKPGHIRIELARDLKRPRKDRKEMAAAMADNRRARAEAARRMAAEGLREPRPRDVQKWLLADECCWQCPYTGKAISFETLFGDHPQFDIEHIIPLPRSLDDSFVNKTLCEVEENRARKGNRTPWEAYHGTDQWQGIIARVKRFRGRAAKAKLELFQREEVRSLEDFTAAQLTDTRYASRLATRYVGLLYGAGETGVDPQRRRRVEASRGAVTRFLRDEWQLNFLGGGEKTRDDHRQHAIDALVVALTTPATIKRLSDAAASAASARRRRFAPMEPPWDGFLGQVRRAIDDMVVSHRVSRKVAAALHEETVYSKPHPNAEGKECVHVRKRLDALSEKEVAEIVDPTVRARVEARLEELGQKDPAKAFKDPKTHPSLRAKDGREIPIHTVRIRVSVAPEMIGGGAYTRRVKLGSNHHVEILEVKDRRGNPHWEGHVVTTKEALRRLKAGEPLVRRDYGEGKEFLFSLARGEIIELNAEQDKKGKTAAEGLYVIRTVTLSGGYPRVDFAAVSDARMKGDVLAAGDWGWASMARLEKRGCRKVVVTPLGEVRWAND
jgi:CRISPR-associated endonuclease Csn1